MTATEELRRMLDERGVEYYTSPNGVAWGKLATPIHGRMYTHYAVELDGLLCVDSHCITPEQAIDATLGSGTCHDLAETPAYRDKTEFKCSECGYEYSAVGGFGCDCGDEPDFNYCPNCGRRVEVGE